MTKQETIQILTILSGNYESFARRTSTDEQVAIMTNTWYECLGDLEYRLVLKAVKRTISTSPYPPTIADIRKNAVEIINPSTQRTAIEAWEEAYRMISSGTYMTEEEFEKASPEVKKFFGSVRQIKELAQCDTDSVNTVTKGQFLKQYESLIQREKTEKLLPQSIKDFTKQLAEKMDVRQIGE